MTQLSRSGRTSVRLAHRASALLAAEGLPNKDIGQQLGIGRVQVARWREHYRQGGIEGIERDLPRGAPPVKLDVERLVELTTQTRPAAAAHWSTRKMAAELGVAPSTVWRHWQDHGPKPHIVRGFTISRDPKSVERLEDVVGLYMSPPEHALVLCCDEKSQAVGNFATHEHPNVQQWLAKLRGGVFTSVAELETAIDECVANHDVNPKPFIWTESARDILQKVIRANALLRSGKNQTLRWHSPGQLGLELTRVRLEPCSGCLQEHC